MPSPLRNGDVAAGPPRLPSPALPPRPHRLHHHHPPFHSTVSEHKIRRLNLLILLLRLAAFCFSLAAAVFTAANSSASASWLSFDSFRLVFAANALVAVYSLLEMCASIREILHGVTLLPEPMQLWFDFAHDQLFAYLGLAAGVAGAAAARRLSGCSAEKPAASFCVQAYISVALAFAGFGFLALSALISGFRVASYFLTGSRFPLLQ